MQTSGTWLELLALNVSVEHNSFALSAERVNLMTIELRNNPGLCQSHQQLKKSNRKQRTEETELLTDFLWLLVAVNYQKNTTDDLKNLFVIRTLGRGPKETITFREAKQQDPRALRPEFLKILKGMLPSAVFAEEVCKDLSVQQPTETASFPLPTTATSVTSPVQGPPERERREPSPVAACTPGHTNWLPHQDLSSCKVTRYHTQASITFDSNHLQTL